MEPADKRTQNLEDWERIEQIIRETGFNINAFARRIGLPRAENLYQIRRGNNGISRELAQRIHHAFPKYSLAWILLGANDLKRVRTIVTTTTTYWEPDIPEPADLPADEETDRI